MTHTKLAENGCCWCLVRAALPLSLARKVSLEAMVCVACKEFFVNGFFLGLLVPHAWSLRCSVVLPLRLANEILCGAGDHVAYIFLQMAVDVGILVGATRMPLATWRWSLALPLRLAHDV